jgi:hypothetical protein
MNEAVGVVENGQIRLEPAVKLPEGATVRILWDEASEARPYDREPVSEEAVRADLSWATGRRCRA